jgi:hypothetical protein
VNAQKDSWAERIAAIAWPVAVVLCALTWQRFLDRLLRRRDEMAAKRPSG